MLRKLFFLIISLTFFFGILYIFRMPLMRSAGNYLIEEDSLQTADAIFVLSGDPYDRGKHTEYLFNNNYSSNIIVTGENVSHNLLALGIPYAEADLTKHYLITNGVDSNAVIVLRKGTSTLEEAKIIADYAAENNMDKIIIVSSLFHTHRVHKYFKPVLKEKNIELIVSGAPSSLYKEERWWEEEDGLIMVNNEYMKLLYYSVKH